MIQRVMDALVKQNEKALSACFAPDGQLLDYCPCVNGGSVYAIYGREGIELLYRGLFALDRLRVAEPDIKSDTEGTFFGAYDGPYVFAHLTIKEIDDGGFIKKAVISPG